MTIEVGEVTAVATPVGQLCWAEQHRTCPLGFGLDLVEQCFALEVDGKRHSAKGSYRFER
jgi:hypothetical protein